MSAKAAKNCSKCLRELPLEAFYYDKKTGRYATVCKECRKTQVRAWQAENKERVRDTQRRYNRKRRDTRASSKRAKESRAFWDAYRYEGESLRGAAIRYVLENHGEIDLQDMLWDNIELVSTDANTQCWVWKRSKFPNGYPKVCVWGDTLPKPLNVTQGHRLSFAIFNRVQPPSHLASRDGDSLVIDHMCSEKRCINPSHLQMTTLSDNSSFRGHHYYGKDTHFSTVREAVESAYALFRLPLTGMGVAA